MKRRFIKNGFCLSFIFIVCLVTIDYLNLPSVLGFNISNLNWDFCMGILNAMLALSLYYFTYKLLDERTIQREKNKKDISVLLICECYNECLNCMNLLTKKTVEKYIVPKVDFNIAANENKIIENLKSLPFLNESTILDLVKDGQIDKGQIERYLNVKSKFIHYINMRIIFFDATEYYAPLESELYKTINDEIERMNI